jgi:hypothetical protein
MTCDRQTVMTQNDAAKLLRRVSVYFNDLAEFYAQSNGFEALALRGYEAVSKISLILAMPGQVRTVEHVEYAFTVVMEDLQTKIHMVTQNETADSKTNDDQVEHFKSKVLQLLSGDPVAGSVLARKLTSGSPKMSKQDVEPFLDAMVNARMIKRTEVKGKGVRYTKL